MNRRMRTRMSGGVGRRGENPLFTRLDLPLLNLSSEQLAKLNIFQEFSTNFNKKLAQW